jgi:dephospho-CoA kinase
MIIGVTGTLGAGKGTIGTFLRDARGFQYFSAREVWVEEVKRRGLPVNRDTITETANSLRAQHGAHYFAELALSKARELGGDAVFESIRTVGEAVYLKKHGALLWAIDADIEARYARIVARQSETDHVSFEKFKEDEQREWENEDPQKQNLKAVIAMADAVFSNNGTLEELHAQVDRALEAAGQ